MASSRLKFTFSFASIIRHRFDTRSVHWDRFSPVSITPRVLHTHLRQHLAVSKKTKWAKPGTLPKSDALSDRQLCRINEYLQIRYKHNMLDTLALLKCRQSRFKTHGICRSWSLAPAVPHNVRSVTFPLQGVSGARSTPVPAQKHKYPCEMSIKIAPYVHL